MAANNRQCHINVSMNPIISVTPITAKKSMNIAIVISSILSITNCLL